VELYFDCFKRLHDVFFIKHELVFMQVLLNTRTTVRRAVYFVFNRHDSGKSQVTR
jgi:hypothetical protein